MDLFNRDLSWLKFNYRVLQEAACTDVPLIERFRFLAISSSNLDEFFRVRYPYILALEELNPKTRKKIHAEGAVALTEAVQEEIHKQQMELGDILINDLIPNLRKEGIVLYYNTVIKEEHAAEVRELFFSRVLAFVQPVIIEGSASYTFEPENNELYLISLLQQQGVDMLRHAVVKIPADKLPRFFRLSPVEGVEYIIFIDDIIRENIDCIFPGYEITGTYSFKVNRDADLNLGDEYAGNILHKIERQLRKRDFGPPSRFLYEYDMPRNVQLFLASLFEIEHNEMFAGAKYHNLRDLMSLPVSNQNLQFPKMPPLSSSQLYNCSDIFKVVEEKDVLLHFPYDSYNPILAFFNQAAIDPLVEEIYIALYRVASDSLIANALISAARNGKKVTVFIELKARFDEANNIQWSKRMEDAGIDIIYSIPEIKVHSKIALVRRKGKDYRKSFCILSTGNFNESTAKFYTDHTLLTADKAINAELLTLFQFLKNREKPSGKTVLFQKLLISQFNMVQTFEQLIANEIKKVKRGGRGLIRIKLNNMDEPGMIEKLYEAGQAGVTVQLIVRSICRIIPAQPGLSDNIEVRRIVGRYLEHTRIFIFGEDEEAKVMMGSADWMARNLYRRIEVCAPVHDDKCRRELLDYFNMQWRDNDKAVRVLPGLLHEKVADGNGVYNAQQEIYNYLRERS